MNDDQLLTTETLREPAAGPPRGRRRPLLLVAITAVAVLILAGLFFWLRSTANTAYARGNEYLQAGDHARAVAAYNHYLAQPGLVRRHDGAALANRGTAYVELGSSEKAIVDIETAFLLGVDTPDLRLRCGQSHLDLAQAQVALDHFDECRRSILYRS